MQKSSRIAEISTKVVGATFYVHPVYQTYVTLLTTLAVIVTEEYCCYSDQILD